MRDTTGKGWRWYPRLSGRVQADPQYGEPLATDLLLAIYHELRHGHDQQAAQAETTAAHTQALAEHTAAMADLRGALLEHADALDRHRNRDR